MKTVFIVGAGASQEAKLPIGSELKVSIARVLNIPFDGFGCKQYDAKIKRALSFAVSEHSYWGDLGPLLNAAQLIHLAMPQASSIDSFIDSHRGNKEIELCGKLAIVRTILEAEAKSAVFVGHRPNGSRVEFNCLENTWFHGFFQLLTYGCTAEDLSKRLESIVFIIFNYDRCIEYYLYHALQNYYRISESETATLLRRLEVYHPYGTVGSIPWLSSNKVIPFGHDPHPQQLLELTRQIKTFTEGTDESSSDVKAIRSHMIQADRLVFLGFAFHQLNMELLLPEKNLSSKQDSGHRRIFATAYGMSSNDATAILDDLSSRTSLPNGPISIRHDLKCQDLIQGYSRSLSFT